MVRRALSAGWRQMKPIFTSRNVVIACAITLVTTMGLGLLEPILPIYFTKTFDMTRTAIGVVFGLTMLFYAIGSPLAGKLSDAVGRKKPILAGLLLTAVITPLIAVFKSVPAVYVLMAAFGFVITFFATPSIPLITDALPAATADGEANQYGAAFGLLNFFWSLGYALGPLLGGAVYQLSGLLTALLVYSGLVLGMTVVVAVTLSDRTGAVEPARVIGEAK